jgi:hypothetical protein
MKMKLLINFIKIIGCFTYYIIGITYPPRNVYISSQISNEQVYHIKKSINKMNLSRTYDKSENLIRVEYCDACYGITRMSATLYSTGSFLIVNTNIGFHPNLTDNILGCVILHELGHSMGLHHNNISNSIMNYTLYLDSDYYVMNDNTECFLSDDDNLGIEYLSKKNK